MHSIDDGLVLVVLLFEAHLHLRGRVLEGLVAVLQASLLLLHIALGPVMFLSLFLDLSVDLLHPPIHPVVLFLQGIDPALHLLEPFHVLVMFFVHLGQFLLLFEESLRSILALAVQLVLLLVILFRDALV